MLPMISSGTFITSSVAIFSDGLFGALGRRFFIGCQKFVTQHLDLFPVLNSEDPESGHDATAEGLRLVSQDVGGPLHEVVLRIHFDEHVALPGVEPFWIDIELQTDKGLD